MRILPEYKTLHTKRDYFSRDAPRAYEHDAMEYFLYSAATMFTNMIRTVPLALVILAGLFAVVMLPHIVVGSFAWGQPWGHVILATIQITATAPLVAALLNTLSE